MQCTFIKSVDIIPIRLFTVHDFPCSFANSKWRGRRIPDCEYKQWNLKGWNHLIRQIFYLSQPKLRLGAWSYTNELLLCFTPVSLCEGFALSTELRRGVVSENHVLLWGKAGSWKTRGDGHWRVGSRTAPTTNNIPIPLRQCHTRLSRSMNNNTGVIN